MKLNFVKTMIAATLILSVVACSNDDDNNNDTAISYEELPEASRMLIETTFEGATVSYAIKKNTADADGTLYETRLSNNFELDFNEVGIWTDIDGNMQQVPDALVPAEILSYTQANYPAPLFIEGIDKESFGYQVEISNDVDLKFNADGSFIGIDN